MKINELIEKYKDINELVAAFKQRFPKEIQHGGVRDQCGVIANHFAHFAADNGFPMVEQVQGFFTVDIPDPENLKPSENINDPKVQEKSKKIPHQWNEFKGQIIDLSGFQQFVETGLANNTNTGRYSY